jgi:hypothetical protein
MLSFRIYALIGVDYTMFAAARKFVWFSSVQGFDFACVSFCLVVIGIRMVVP